MNSFNNFKCNNNDIIAYKRIKTLYETQEYNELYDILYHYMNAFIDECFDIILFRDEFENVTGISSHEEIVDYILNKLY